MSHKHLVFIFSSILILCAAASSQTVFCPQIASYTMDVKLDPTNKLITGTELLTWANATDHEASELWFHHHFTGGRSGGGHDKSLFLPLADLAAACDGGFHPIRRLSPK